MRFLFFFVIVSSFAANDFASIRVSPFQVHSVVFPQHGICVILLVNAASRFPPPSSCLRRIFFSYVRFSPQQQEPSAFGFLCGGPGQPCVNGPISSKPSSSTLLRPFKEADYEKNLSVKAGPSLPFNGGWRTVARLCFSPPGSPRSGEYLRR